MKHHINILLIVIFVLFASRFAGGQNELKFANLGDFRLENGQVIRACRIGYRTFGRLNQNKSNAILVTTSFTSSTQDIIPQIGPGKLLDNSKYFVIAVDALGNGVSSSPSNSRAQPGRSFPSFSIRDMVNTQHKLLAQELKLNRVHAITGISMGGMQTLQWIISYPDFMDKAIPIVGTPRQTSYDLLLWRTQLQAIEAMRSCANGESKALQMMADLNALMLWSPSYIVNQTPPEGVQQFMATREKQLMSYNVNNYAAQLKAMIDHDIYKSFGGSAERAAAAVRARVLMVVSPQDHIVNPAPALEFAKRLKAETLSLTGDCGHLAFRCEMDKLTAAVSAFLNK
jgi:homoserine O-acetyltransferase